MREIDRLTTERYDVPSLTLMENAAAATARVVIDCLNGDATGKTVLVFCGKGNNGGDGAAAARLLATAGARVDVVLVGSVEEIKGDARTNFERLRAWNDEQALCEEREGSANGPSRVNIFECDSEKGWEQLAAGVLSIPHDVALDSLFCTGLSRPVEGIYLDAIRYLNQGRAARDTCAE